MAIALQTPGLATQPLPGVGLRLVRRIGGAVRSVFARGITLAGGSRRAAAPQPDAAPDSATTPEAPPAPDCAPRRRRISKAEGRRRARRFLRPLDDYVPFTPEEFPNLSPETCALLNTPLEDCDPAMAEQLLAGFTARLAAAMPADTGLNDADALFATLWGRLGAILRQAAPDAAPDAGAEAPADAPASPNPLPPAESSAPAEAASDARPAPSLPFPDAPPIHLPLGGVLASASALTPVITDFPATFLRNTGTLLRRCRPFGTRRGPAFRRMRRLYCAWRAMVRRTGVNHRVPAPWCYAARASPS